MDEEIRKINDAMKDFPYELKLVDPKEIMLMDKNARYMTDEMFQNLVKNIKADGNLSTVPLCINEESGALRVVSGNHRVQAAVAAGLTLVLVFIVKGNLTREETVALQISHNAIEGKDDPVILRDLFEEIKDIDLMFYAGLDSEMVKKLEGMEFDTISEARLDFKIITLMFLPEEVDQLKAILEQIDAFCVGDTTYLLGREHYDETFNMIVKAKEDYDIVNNATAFMKLLSLAKERMDDGL